MSTYVYEAGDLAVLTLEVPEADGSTTAAVTAWTDPAGVAVSPPAATGSVDRKLWEAVAPVPTAGEWTATWTVSGTGAAKRSYAVQVGPTPPSTARTYATTEDYAEWLQAAPKAGSARLLVAATRVVDRNTVAAVYDVTGTDEMPTDATIRQAFREAVCAQVEAWQENGTGPAGPGAGQWQTMTAGRVSLGRAGGAAVVGPHGNQLAPDARGILQDAGLIARPWQA